MANLSDESEEGVSLFPMFNILACTLGVMVFVLATVATVSLGADRAVQFSGAEFPEEQFEPAPTFVEWDGHRMVLYPSMASVRFDQDLDTIATFEETYAYMFDQLVGTRVGSELAAAGLDPTSYVFLLVRPSGFRTFAEVRGYLQLLGTDLVHEPLEQDLRRIQVR